MAGITTQKKQLIFTMFLLAYAKTITNSNRKEWRDKYSAMQKHKVDLLVKDRIDKARLY